MQIVGWNPSADGSDRAYSNLREFIHGTGPTTHQFCLSVSLPPLAGRSSFFYLYFWPLHPFLLQYTERYEGSRRLVEEAWSFPWNYGAVNGTKLPREKGGRVKLMKSRRASHDAQLLAWNVQIVPGLRSRFYDWTLNLSFALEKTISL